ncbi:transposase [Streptomyces sp. NPDC007896]|uniref:transposase n=1 Tax=Streptomyces sp. NPDC007896 TaxID=3364784 RepID=UPI0036EFF5F9
MARAAAARPVRHSVRASGLGGQRRHVRRAVHRRRPLRLPKSEDGGARRNRNPRSRRCPPRRLPRRLTQPRLPTGRLHRPGRLGHRRPRLRTTQLDPEQYPAAELVELYRERCEIEPAFDEIKTHLGRGGRIRSRTPEGVRQELWAYLAFHHAIRQFSHAAALAGPTLDADHISHLRCVRIIRRSVPSQIRAATAKLTRSLTDAGQEGHSRLQSAPCNRKCPRAIKKPNRWPVLRSRAGLDTVEPGRWTLNQTKKTNSGRRTGRPVLNERE